MEGSGRWVTRVVKQCNGDLCLSEAPVAGLVLLAWHSLLDSAVFLLKRNSSIERNIRQNRRLSVMGPDKDQTPQDQSELSAPVVQPQKTKHAPLPSPGHQQLLLLPRFWAGAWALPSCILCEIY